MSSSTDAAQAAENAGEMSGGKRPERKALGKYEIQKKIGAGGMGAVFLALDTELRRTVALKVLPKERAQNPMLVRRFKSEGQAAAHLRHSNLVTVFEAGEIDGYLYIALEYVDGTDVHHLVEKRGPIPVKRTIAIVRQIAKALVHAYEQNIVHRDIKPSNLLIQRDGSVKLTDFGLARFLDEETETAITRAGTTVGTVDYMSPEQARDSKAADIRSDLYSLGCTWYHMLTGGPPYPEGAVTNKLQAHATAPLPDPRDKNPAVPEGIVAIVHRLMAKDSADRYQTPAELLADLDSPALGRQTLSNNLLASLADGDADSPARPARQTAPPPAGHPPAERKPAAAAPAKSSEGVDPEYVRYFIVAAIVLALLGLVWWVISQFASNIDPPSDTTNPFAGTEDVPRYGDAERVVVRNASQPPAGSASSQLPGEAPGGDPQGNDAAAEDPDRSAVAESAGDHASTADSPGDEPAREAVPTEQPRGAGHQVARGEPLPDWVAAFAADVKEFRGADGEPLPVVTVGRASGEPADFAQLETALARVPRTGGIVRLTGPGPFDLTPTRVAVAGPLVIEAAAGDRPVVVLRPQRSGAVGRILQVETSSLLLSGLDLVTVAEQFATDDPLSLLEVIGDEAALRDCTITLMGERSGPTLAVRTIGRTGAEGAAARADPGRVLMDRVFLRGERLSALAVSRIDCDAVVNDCLLVCGEAPVFVVSAPPSASRDAPMQSDSDRVLRLFSTTAVSSRSGFFLEHQDGEPPATQVAILNSIVSAPGRRRTGSLLELGAWPGTDSEPSSWAPQNVHFDVSGSLFPGWAALARSAGQPRAITNSTDWGRLWNNPVPLSAFPPEGWPEGDVSPGDLAAERFERTTAGRRVSGTDGEPPGCVTELLSQPAPEFIDRASAMAARPIEPADFETGSLGARTVTIDASREDVGAVISRGQWDNGTRFLITGSGRCRTSPVEVRGKSLSIEFVQAGEPRLCLEPLEAAFAGGGRALITVEQGHLRLVNACARISHADGDGPRWFLHLTDGNFSLADCAISGPPNGEGGWEGFLRWDRRDHMGGAGTAGRYSQFARIANSFLCGAGTLLRADIEDRAFVARESVLAARDGGLVLHVHGGDREASAAVELSNCTVATGGTFLDVQGRRGAISPNEALRFFVEQTVFAPLSTGSSPAMAAVLLRDTSGRAPRRIEWWGHSNGYANGFARFLHSGTPSSAAESDFERWLKTWGPAGDLRPLSESGAVQIQNSQPGDTLIPADFALVESSPARTWSPTGRPIGADATRLPQPGP